MLRGPLWSVPLIAASGVVAYQVTYLAGGTRTVFPHLFYVPVVVAAAAWGPWGGLATGVAAGVLCGPLMPLQVDVGLGQEPAQWLVRMLFFVAIGMLTGGLTKSVRRQVTRLEQLNDESIRAFVHAIDAKSPYTARHSERVAAFAGHLGREIGLSDDEVNRLHWAGLLHDIGKIAIPDGVLSKPGRLTAEEWELIRRHPLESVRIVQGVKRFRPLLPAIRHHHERIDGRGYPDGVSGDRVSRDARILAIADAFEAMTSDRPYRPSMSEAAALEELRAGAGTQFDPDLVDAFISSRDAVPHGGMLRQHLPVVLTQSPRPRRSRNRGSYKTSGNTG